MAGSSPMSMGVFLMDSLKGRNFLMIYWIALAVLILASDYLTGPFIQFPVLYLIPITLASWYNGYLWGISLALTMILTRFLFSFFWPASMTISCLVTNTIIRIVVLTLLAFLVGIVARQKRELEKEVRILRGILPICSFCKKIRDPDGNWEVMERYISAHSEAKFSHGICPECVNQHYPEILRG